MMVKRCMPIVLTAALLLAGCRGGKVDEAMLKGVVEQYVTAVASQQFDRAAEVTTGDAAAALLQLRPLLEELEYKSEVRNLSVRVLEADEEEARLEATYVLEQTIPDLGTTVGEYRVRYWLAPVEGKWRIFQVATVEQHESEDGGS